MGWFKNGLHGYGKEVKLLDERKTTYEGLFVKGQRRKTTDENDDNDEGLNVKTAFNAQKIIWT